MKLDKDYEHGKYIDLLENIIIDDLKDYDLANILYNDIGFSFDMNYSFIIKNIFKMLFTNYLKIIKKGTDKEVLLFTYVYNRKDHDTYWEHFKGIVEDYQEIIITYSRSSISFNKNFLKNLIKYIYIFNELKDINYVKSRIWLSLQIFNAIKIKKSLDKINCKCGILYTFFDGGFEGNIMSQYFKKKGATTVTLQHGQCLFRDKNRDRVNQSIILNFISDYCLCKGKFAKKQFLEAGVSPNRVLPLGNLDSVKKINSSFLKEKEIKNVMCIFLDTPSYPFYDFSTEELISVANKYSEKFSFRYYVKPHPADIKKTYNKFINNNFCLGILNNNFSLEEIDKMVDFSIFHASAIYTDMLLIYMKSYKLKTKIKFDIVLNEFDIFEDENQLNKRVEEWSNMDLTCKKEYYERQNYLYSNPDNVENRYKQFIKSII